jgi:cytidylate kinase
MTIKLPQIVDAVARMNRYLDETPEKGARADGPRPFTIALAREAGAGGSTVAQAIGARLGWPVYDKDLLQRIAEEKGLHPRLLEGHDEQHIDWLTATMRRLCAVPTTDAYVYFKPLLRVLAALSEQGHCIIVGRGAGIVLPAETTLSVRLVAPRPLRIACMAKKLGLSPAEAERWVDRTDGERCRFIKDHFHQDCTDPHNYDLVLNSGRLPTDECARVIIEALQAKEALLKPARA